MNAVGIYLWSWGPTPTRTHSAARVRRASLRRLARAAGARGGSNLALDALDELGAGEPIGHRNRVAHRLRTRAAVAHDGDAGDAEQRCAAVLRVVDAPVETSQRAVRQERSDAHRDGARQLLFQEILDDFHQSFADLQRDVAGEP